MFASSAQMTSLNLGDHLHKVGQTSRVIYAREILTCLLRKLPAYLVRILAYKVGVRRNILHGPVRAFILDLW